jgi:uncharacterized membrane protein
LNPQLQPARGNPAASLDAGFAEHSRLTFVHIIPGALFLLLGPLQFIPKIRNRALRFHRWSGRVFLVCGGVIGVSALLMSFGMAIGGANETAATTLFALIFLFDLARAYTSIRKRRVSEHREWMIRAFAIGLAIATIRPIVGAFFAARMLSPHEFFGIAFWIGFTVHLIAAEVWINYTRAMPTTIAAHTELHRHVAQI